MSFSATRISPFAPALVCLIGITVLSLTSGVQLPGFQMLSADKLAHAIAYGLLSFLIAHGLHLTRNRNLRTTEWVGAGFFASGYGALMEWAQHRFTTGRFFEYDDMIANCVGAALGLTLFHLSFKTKAR